MAEYHIQVSQNGTNIMPSLRSCLTFERILTMTKIGQNAKKFKWDQSILNTSIYVAPGSSLNAPKFSNSALILVVNKSISGLRHKCSNVRFKKINWIIHSVSTWFDRDSLSATVFSFPGMWYCVKSVQIWTRNNSVFGHFSRSVSCWNMIFVNNDPLSNFKNLVMTFHWMWCSQFVNALDCCGNVRYDFNVFMTCFYKRS